MKFKISKTLKSSRSQNKVRAQYTLLRKVTVLALNTPGNISFNKKLMLCKMLAVFYLKIQKI
jgi:hypothetical protein